jgi:ABC-type Mn2+/Zn2+ transport system permease subunit
MLWAMGAALFAHAVTFISVSYFDQNFVNWYLLLAIIGTLTGPFLVLKRHEFLESVQPAADSDPLPLHSSHQLRT